MIITIKDGVQAGKFATRREYYSQRGPLAKLVMPITKRLRSRAVLALMEPRQRHLDIGCGDGFLLKRSPCRECYGLDEIYGDTFTDSLPFPDQYFNYVTMLAVVEHLDDAGWAFWEVHRVLRPGGVFILTTPKRWAAGILRMVDRNIGDAYKVYFDRDSMARWTEGLFEVSHYRPFMLGLNQLFCLVSWPA